LSKQFWMFLGIGLAVVALGLGVMLLSTKGAHLELDGRILHVRVLSLNPNASIVVLDFRAKNPSDVQFVVKNVELVLEPASGEPIVGMSISKADVDNVFKYEKLLGPKYNDVLTIRDKIGARQTLDRMDGARFELGEAAIDARKSIKLRIEDMDGTIAEIVEKK
jgi:hypothetical protein